MVELDRRDAVADVRHVGPQQWMVVSIAVPNRVAPSRSTNSDCATNRPPRRFATIGIEQEEAATRTTPICSTDADGSRTAVRPDRPRGRPTRPAPGYDAAMRTLVLALSASAGVVVAGSFLLRAPEPATSTCRCTERLADFLKRRPASPAGREFRAPATFVANRGQWRTDARFVARGGGMTVGLADDRIEFDLHGAAPGQGVLLRWRLDGALPTAAWHGHQSAPGRHSFFLGGEHGVTDVPAFARVVLAQAWPGIDLAFRDRDGALEYDLLLAPGADPDAIAFRSEGHERLRLDADGALLVDTGLGTLRQSPPLAFVASADGDRAPLASRFVLRGDDRFGFVVPGWDGRSELLIDPGITWGTYLGGADDDLAQAVAADAPGRVVAAGTTRSVDFPASPGAYQRTYGGHNTQPWPFGDVFVARFHGANGALDWATYVGGSENDVCAAVRTAANGDVLVSGWTSSTDYPTTPGAFDRTHNGTGAGYQYTGGDLFVTRLASSGQSLVFSTFIGGNDLEYVLGMDADADGAVTLSGHVHSFDFPVTPGAFAPTMTGGSDCYVTRLSADGSRLLLSTYFGGGTGEEYGYGVAVARNGDAIIAGGTDSRDLPVTAGAFDTTFNGGQAHIADGFVARFDATGSSLLWSTFLGSPDDDFVRAVALERNGMVTVAGETNGPAFPTTPGAYDTSHNGLLDAFVTRLTADGSALVWSTFVGGGDDDYAGAVVADGSGRVVVGGLTKSPAFPTTDGAFDRTHNGDGDAFVLRLTTAGSRLDYSTFLGSPWWEMANALAIRPDGDVCLTGFTWHPAMPVTPGSFSTLHAGRNDGFVFRMDLLPTGARRAGGATAGCAGLPYTGVPSMPRVGNAAFAITAARVAPGAAGIVCLGTTVLAAPVRVLGADLWLDPATILVCLSTQADAFGGASAPLPIPANPGLAGARLAAQLLAIDACAQGGVAASNVVVVDVQP
jgi:hypothetical protein